jgi:hypothetical protein
VDRARVMEHVRGLGLHNPAGILEHQVIGPGAGPVAPAVDHVLADEDGRPAEFETVAEILRSSASCGRAQNARGQHSSVLRMRHRGHRGGQSRPRSCSREPRAEALFGYERDELVGLRVEVLIPDRVRHVRAVPGGLLRATRTRPMGLG